MQKKPYYQDNLVKIYNADSQDLSFIDDNSIDLIVTSPPYNIGLKYDVDPDNLSMSEYRKFILNVCKELYRITKIGGRFCLNIGYRVNTLNREDESLETLELILDIRNLGWIARETIIWVKTREPETPQNFCGSNTAWGSWLSASNPICRSYCEFIFVFHKQSWKKEPIGISDITKEEFFDYSRNVWYFPAETQRIHPAPFPKELPYRCIKFYSYVGDVVLDPFAGSGTTGIVAKELKRKAILVEISEKYCKIASIRCGQGVLF